MNPAVDRKAKSAASGRFVAWLEDLGSGDVDRVGGKNASLGEMISALMERGS